MVPFLPKQVTYRAIITYLIALTVISLFFSDYAMRFGYMALGFLFVIGFFSLTTTWSMEKGESERDFVKFLFVSAVVFRLVWVVASYFGLSRRNQVACQ